MGVNIRWELIEIKMMYLGKKNKPQAFRKTADNESRFENFLDHAETGRRSSFEILEDIYLRRVALL